MRDEADGIGIGARSCGPAPKLRGRGRFHGRCTADMFRGRVGGLGDEDAEDFQRCGPWSLICTSSCC
jgi:hypothetical protein